MGKSARLLVLTALAILLPATARPDATVSGTIASGGTAVAGAFVAAVGTAGQYAAVADATGSYSLGTVAAGTYTIRAGAQGYAVAETTGVTVTTGPVTQDVALTASGSKFTALPVYGGQISGIVADGLSGVFYASTSVIPQVFRTADYGGSWAPVTLQADDATHGLDGSNSSGGLTTSGYPGELATTVNGKIYYSTDFGTTWAAVGGTVNGFATLYWGHAGSVSTLVAVSGTATKRADMTATTPTLQDMTTPYLGGANDRMAVGTGSDRPYVAVVTSTGDLKVYDLNTTDDPPVQVGTTLAGFPTSPVFVRFGGARASGAPPAAVLVYASSGPSGTAIMATKDPTATAFVSGDMSASTSVPGNCGAGPGAIGSVSPLSTGTTGAGTISQCFLTKSGTGSLVLNQVNGINNNTGLAFDSGYDGSTNQVLLSGDGNRGVVKSASATSGVPQFPTQQDAAAGTGSTSGGVAVNGFTVPVIKDSVFGPLGGMQVAVSLSGSGGGLGVASEDGGATFQTVVTKGGYAVDWWEGASATTWLVFGHGGAGNLLSAVTGWSAATPKLIGPNVAGTDGTAIGTGSGGSFSVTALAGVIGADTIFIGGGDNVDQDGSNGSLVRANLTAGSPNPTISGITTVATGLAAVRALAYCPTTGSDATVQDVLLVATGSNSGGALVRVTDATTGAPSASTIASVSGRVNDVRVHCASGTVYAGTGTNGGGPSGVLYKSTDGGVTFAPVALSGPGVSPNLNIQVVAINPSNVDEVLLAGNSEGNILRSTDGGATWTTVNDPHAPGGRNFLSEGVGDLEIPPASSAQLAGVTPPTAARALVGTGGGLFAASVLGAGAGGPCTTVADCSSGGTCTDVACTGGQCVVTEPSGCDGAACELAAIAAGLCTDGAISAKVQAALRKQATRVGKLLTKACAASGKKHDKLVAAAEKLVKKLGGQLTRAQHKRRVSIECAAAIEEARAVVASLLADL
ncbi:MAG: hypothetical protein U0807_08635 [Candidatus Binatia bacterium]